MAKILTLFIAIVAVTFNINMANAAKTYYFYEKLPAGIIAGSDSDVAFGNAAAGEYTGDVTITVTDPAPLNINLTEATEVPVTLSSGTVSDWSTVTVDAVVTSGSSYVGAVTISGTGTSRTVSVASTGSTAGTAIIKLTALLNGVNNSVKNITVTVEDLGFTCNSTDPLSNIPQNGGVYEISNKEQLICLSNYQTAGVLVANYKLMNDIEFAGSGEDWDIVGSNDSQGWKPLGDYTTNTSLIFTGGFDGNNHTISGLYINRPTAPRQGFFGWTENLNLTNLGLVNVNVTGQNRTGSLVGNLYTNSSVDNCYSTGSVSGGDYIGGLVGMVYDGATVNNSYSSATVSGVNSIGGLLGRTLTNVTTTNSYATGTVSGSGDSVGGLVGNSESGSTINDSYAITGNVSGARFIGGLVGRFYTSTINRCYAKRTVSGTQYIGGLIGNADSSSTINTSYATGGVSGTSNYVGGLTGALVNSSINNCYAKGNVNGSVETGGIAGVIHVGASVNNTYSTGVTSGGSRLGSLVGYDTESGGTAMTNSYALNNSGIQAVGLPSKSSANQYCSVGGGTTCNTSTIQSAWNTSIWNTGANPTLIGVGGQ